MTLEKPLDYQVSTVERHIICSPDSISGIANSLESFADYSKWRGRRNKGDLKSGMRRGLVVSSWNQWVESQGGEGVATLAGVASGILDCYLDGYRYRVCRNAGELAEEVSRRESLLG